MEGQRGVKGINGSRKDVETFRIRLFMQMVYWEKPMNLPLESLKKLGSVIPI